VNTWGWPPLRPPKGKGSVEDLRKESLANGVSAVRAIQTLTFYGVDNRYLNDSAKANKGWLAGVCNLDPDDPHSPLLLREFVRDYGVRSLRSVPSPKHKTFDDPGVRALWKMAIDEGATVDIFLMQPEMVDSATKIIADFPQLTIGFCHCMDLKPGPLLASNLDKVRRLARFKNLYPKVDFIGTGTNLPYLAPTCMTPPSKSSTRMARSAACGRAFIPTHCGHPGLLTRSSSGSSPMRSA